MRMLSAKLRVRLIQMYASCRDERGQTLLLRHAFAAHLNELYIIKNLFFWISETEGINKKGD